MSSKLIILFIVINNKGSDCFLGIFKKSIIMKTNNRGVTADSKVGLT